jgi:hypothetical protein
LFFSFCIPLLLWTDDLPASLHMSPNISDDICHSDPPQVYFCHELFSLLQSTLLGISFLPCLYVVQTSQRNQYIHTAQATRFWLIWDVTGDPRVAAICHQFNRCLGPRFISTICTDFAKLQHGVTVSYLNVHLSSLSAFVSLCVPLCLSFCPFFFYFIIFSSIPLSSPSSFLYYDTVDM